MTDEAMELLPCPFCEGTQLEELPVTNTRGHWRFIYCIACSAQGPWSFKPATAANMWNRRALAAQSALAEEKREFALLNAEHWRLGEQRDKLLERTQAAEVRAGEAEQDARRFAWWFSNETKHGDIVNEYLRGVREQWTLDKWRAAIDAASAAPPASPAGKVE